MDHRETTVATDKIHQNRLSSLTDDEGEQDAAFTIVRVLDKVAAIVDSVQASQKRIEERHREMEDAIKTIQIDILKLAQVHGNTGYTVDKLLEKTRKVSTRVKEVRERLEKQSANVRKVEDKQEEMLRKNKFRVVIYQVRLCCVFNGYHFRRSPSCLTSHREVNCLSSISMRYCPFFSLISVSGQVAV